MGSLVAVVDVQLKLLVILLLVFPIIEHKPI